MNFRVGKKQYSGNSAVEIIRSLQRDVVGDRSQGLSLRQFLLWSLSQLDHQIPSRELDVSDKLSDEVVALNYLYLRDDYGAGRFQRYA
jgi:hypothetical protein